MDRVATYTDPLTRQETFAYDLNGNATTWTDRKGQVTAYTYDALDRKTFVGFGATGTPPNYASTVTNTYDAGNRLTQIVDSGAGTISHTYDLLDQLTQEVTPEGTIAFTYDAAGRRATGTVTGQTAVSYSYDNADRLTGITRGTAAVSLAYDNADRRTSLTLPNGIVIEYGYDDDSHLTGLTYKQGGSTIGGLTYGYDGNAQRTSVAGTWARTTLPSALASATYDDANQIVAWASTSFTYDNNGNLTSDGTRTYTWNVRNELASLTGSVNGSYAYDAFGRRRSKTIGGTTTQFLYDGLNSVQELAAGTPTANLLPGLGIDEYFTRTDSAGVRNYLTDALGSSVALSDGSGTVQTSYTYEPFGSLSTSGAATSNTFGFTGREADATGLQFYRARYYDPKLQRFIQQDPIGFLGGDVTLYVYVGNDPINASDPLGLQKAEQVMRVVSDFSAGLGDTLSFGLTEFFRQFWDYDDVVDKCAGAYGAGGGTGLGIGLGIGGSGLLRGAFRFEFGNWKTRAGRWFFPRGMKGPHFHWGNAPGLQTHHLPWQIANYFRNFVAKYKSGQAKADLLNLLKMLYGGALAGANGNLEGRGCGCK